MPARPTFRYAAVDGPSDDQLKAVKVFDWDGHFDPFGLDQRLMGKLLKRIGLVREPRAWVDVTERPDIAEGETFPFQPRPEPDPFAPAAPVAPEHP